MGLRRVLPEKHRHSSQLRYYDNHCADRRGGGRRPNLLLVYDREPQTVRRPESHWCDQLEASRNGSVASRRRWTDWVFNWHRIGRRVLQLFRPPVGYPGDHPYVAKRRTYRSEYFVRCNPGEHLEFAPGLGP